MLAEGCRKYSQCSSTLISVLYCSEVCPNCVSLLPFFCLHLILIKELGSASQQTIVVAQIHAKRNTQTRLWSVVRASAVILLWLKLSYQFQFYQLSLLLLMSSVWDRITLAVRITCSTPVGWSPGIRQTHLEVHRIPTWNISWKKEKKWQSCLKSWPFKKLFFFVFFNLTDYGTHHLVGDTFQL